jgi:hypothetical protein
MSMWDSETYDTDHGRQQLPDDRQMDDDDDERDGHGEKSDEIYEDRVVIRHPDPEIDYASDSGSEKSDKMYDIDHGRQQVSDDRQMDDERNGHDENSSNSDIEHPSDDDSGNEYDVYHNKEIQDVRVNVETLEKTIFNLAARMWGFQIKHPRIAEKYLNLTQAEVEWIPKNSRGDGHWNILCNIITIQAGCDHSPEPHTSEPREESDLSEMMTSIRLEDQDQLAKILEPLKLPPNESLDDMMSEMMEVLHIPPAEDSVATMQSTQREIDWYRVSSLWEWYGNNCLFIEQVNQTQTWVMDILHALRMHNNLDDIFDDKLTVDALQSWPSNLINCSSSYSRETDYGTHEAKYIPFISLMLRRHMMLGITTKTNWTVLLYTDESLYIDKPFSSNTLACLRERFTKLGPKIEKVIIVFNIDKGAKTIEATGEGKEEHIWCVFISRSGPTPFITLLDDRWATDWFKEGNRDYIKRMVQIAKATGIKPITILLSREAGLWKDNELQRMMDDDLDLDRMNLSETHTRDRPAFFPTVIFKNYEWAETQKMQWLSDTLDESINYDITPHSTFRIWEKLYTPLLHITSCIDETVINHDVHIKSAVDEIHRIRSKINRELTARILAGDYLLSPASVQFALQRTDLDDNTFYLINGTDQPPSETYAWSISPLGRGGMRVHALKHDLKRFNSEFHWTRVEFSGRPETSKAFLHELRARALINTSPSTKKQRSDDMEEDGRARRRARISNKQKPSRLPRI